MNDHRHRPDAGRLALMLGELRLPTIARAWPDLAETPTARAGQPPASSPP